MQYEQKMSLPMLTAMVVGSMVGAGIFSLPRTFDSSAVIAPGKSNSWKVA